MKRQNIALSFRESPTRKVYSKEASSPLVFQRKHELSFFNETKLNRQPVSSPSLLSTATESSAQMLPKQGSRKHIARETRNGSPEKYSSVYHGGRAPSPDKFDHKCSPNTKDANYSRFFATKGITSPVSSEAKLTASAQKCKFPRSFFLESLDSTAMKSVFSDKPTRNFTTSPPKSCQARKNHHRVKCHQNDQILSETNEKSPSMFLRSGEDAILYFAQNGARTGIKYILLKRPINSLIFRPYDLIVVEPDEVHSEYFTMSSSGLVHVQEGKPSEFIALDEWIRESSSFNVITSFRFFKFYLVRKAFTGWIAQTHRQIFRYQQKKLKSKLFLAKKSFCRPLIDVKTLMTVEVQSVTFVELKVQKTYDHISFAEQQALKRNEALKELEFCIEKLQTVLFQVCLDVKAAAKTKKVPESGRLSIIDSILAEKAKSIVHFKSEALKEKKAIRQAAEEALMIPDLIKLVDLITVESIAELVIQRCITFLEEMKRENRKTGIFETTMFFDEDDVMKLTPTSQQIQYTVISMTDDIVSTATSVPRVLHFRHFAPYIGEIATETANVGTIATRSTLYQTAQENITEKVLQDFSEASEYLRSFENIRPIYEYDKAWNLEDYAQQTHTVASLKAEMAQLIQWEKELDKMRVGHTIGILHVESRKLKQSLVPACSAKVDELKTLIRDLARARCKKTLNEYKQHTQLLAQRPVPLKEFASFVQRIRSVIQSQKVLHKNTNAVEDLYRLLAQHGVRVSSEDMVQLDDLRGIQDIFRRDLDSANAFVESRMEEMSEQLNKNIERLDEKVIQVNTQLRDTHFSSPVKYHDANQVKIQLEALKLKLTQYGDLAKQYSDYQALFTQSVPVYLNLQVTQDQMTTLFDLWSGIDLWQNSYNSIISVSFQELDFVVLNEQTGAAYAQACTFDSSLKSELTNFHKDNIADLKHKMDFLSGLGSSSVRDRHWEKIFNSLGKAWYPGIHFTLQNLIDFGILDLKDMISGICADAAKELQ
uniref:Dynein heavy chain putative n=1 Tax=Albugo laibachii Nc14 TaxID=890382 RepID=F0WI44_9STRA|nr:dynein heavy chain putative [Albugo laibachii Nc14]|eukprot:CCA20922.1 dynein heavy chain putative [Albugo laibachii Nc14]